LRNDPNSPDIQITFGRRQGDHLEFLFHSADLSRLKKMAAGNWLRPRVSVYAGGFQGEASPFVEARDFVVFLADLRKLFTELKGTATFTTTETQIGFVLSGDGLGHIKLQGHLLDRAGIGNRLEFMISYDQTSLADSIAGIERLVNATAFRR
jgi:hypothetical protein